MVNDELRKDPYGMYSDIPVNQHERLKTLTDDELWDLYNKFNERDDLPDSPSDDIHDINDRIVHKDALIAEMNWRGLFDKIDAREHHLS